MMYSATTKNNSIDIELCIKNSKYVGKIAFKHIMQNVLLCLFKNTNSYVHRLPTWIWNT